MAKRTFAPGATSQSMDIFIADSSSIVGAGLTGLVFNSGGLTAYYRSTATGTPTAFTLATQTVGGAWSSGGFVAVDGTNMPGVYRLDIPNVVLASAPYAVIYLQGATNMVPSVSELEIRTNVEIADAILDRDMSLGTDSGSSSVRTVRQALRILRNLTQISGGINLTVHKEDDLAVSWTAVLTTDANQAPIVGMDPT